MAATVRDIGGEKLVVLARCLDAFPPLVDGQKEEDVEQYYSLLCVELSSLPPPLGQRFTYTRSEVHTIYTITLICMATSTDLHNMILYNMCRSFVSILYA